MENLKNMVDDLKKSLQKNFGHENGNFFLRKRHSEILICETNFRPPKLGARSPPLPEIWEE